MLGQKKRVYLLCLKIEKLKPMNNYVWKKNKLFVNYCLPVKLSSYVRIQFRISFQVNRGGGLPPRNLYKFNGRF